jgi:hypothetical protein
MNRLQSELNRLYLADPSAASLIDAQGLVRAMVMELAQPASWEVLSAVWQGVQSELQLPAPAIAVSGVDGLQLWFSLEEPITVHEAHAFLDSLRARFLPTIDPKRFRLLPETDAAALHAALVPAQQPITDNWSAFVAPDLAAVFTDAPWLDVAPNEEGQANLLRGLPSMKRRSFEDASRRLVAHALPPSAAASPTTVPSEAAPAGSDPKRFLMQVMNDEAVPLALRIEAAKALLPYVDPARPPAGT